MGRWGGLRGRGMSLVVSCLADFLFREEGNRGCGFADVVA